MLKRDTEKGITLIGLVVTIIVLLILAGISIAMLTGDNGILTNAKLSKEENRKQTATEILKIKITECQMKSIGEKSEYPTLAYLAAFLDSDDEISYVDKQSKPLASLNETLYKDWDVIYTKLKKYPSYEFEIHNDFQVSVNGEQVSVPVGYMKIPTETLDITKNETGIDVKNYAKVNVNVPTGEGTYFASGTFDAEKQNVYDIHVGFTPSKFVISNRSNFASLIYNSSINSSVAHFWGEAGSFEQPIGTQDTSISNIQSFDGDTIKFYSHINGNWHWFAVK